MKVNIYWMRHGESCTNVIARQMPWYMQYKRFLFLDPQITDGAEAAIRRQPLVKAVRPQLVVSSRLLRAIQTARLNYPRYMIHVLCGNSEIVPGRGNQFSSREHQKKHLRSTERIIYPRKEQCERESSYPHFMAALAHLVSERGRNWPDNKPFNVVAVGHSQWMRKNLEVTSRNLQTWFIPYNLDPTTLEWTQLKKPRSIRRGMEPSADYGNCHF